MYYKNSYIKINEPYALFKDMCDFIYLFTFFFTSEFSFLNPYAGVLFLLISERLIGELTLGFISWTVN